MDRVDFDRDTKPKRYGQLNVNNQAAVDCIGSYFNGSVATLVARFGVSINKLAVHWIG